MGKSPVYHRFLLQLGNKSHHVLQCGWCHTWENGIGNVQQVLIVKRLNTNTQEAVEETTRQTFSPTTFRERVLARKETKINVCVKLRIELRNENSWSVIK